MGGPKATANASVYQTWQTLVVGGILFLMIAFMLVVYFSNYLRRAIEGIAHIAQRLGSGETVNPIQTRISEIALVSEALADASNDRQKREEKIEFVMRELAHRTKNLITVVLSMVRQTSRNCSSIEEQTRLITDRVSGLAIPLIC